jgi:hypothetical protein
MREHWPGYLAAADFISKVVVEGADLGEPYSSDEEELAVFPGFDPPPFEGNWEDLCL